MSSEDSLVTTYHQGDDGAGEGAVVVLISKLLAVDDLCEPPHRRTIQTVLHLLLRMFAICSLGRPRLGHTAFLGVERAFEHFVEAESALSRPDHVTSELWLGRERTVEGPVELWVKSVCCR